MQALFVLGPQTTRRMEGHGIGQLDWTSARGLAVALVLREKIFERILLRRDAIMQVSAGARTQDSGLSVSIATDKPMGKLHRH